MDMQFTSHTSRSTSDMVLFELRKIVRALDLNSKSLVRRVGLTGPQLVILKEIAVDDEASMGNIAHRAGLSQGTVTGIIERLEKRGLAIRCKSESDRRRVLVKITDDGKKILAKAPPLMQEDFVKNFNRLPPWTQTMILSSVQQLAGIMDVKDMVQCGEDLSALGKAAENKKIETNENGVDIKDSFWL